MTTEPSTVRERQRYAVRKGIEKVKAEVSINDYLQEMGVEIKRNRARCIVHGGDNPNSFSIDPEQGLWHCFSCGEGGDLITLCELVERHVETWTAMVSLAQQFGVELPRRPERWHKRQDEKAKVQDQIWDALTASYQRRLFRVFGGQLEDIADPDERTAEARLFYESLYSAARTCARNRLTR